jgi:hypothetical protein
MPETLRCSPNLVRKIIEAALLSPVDAGAVCWSGCSDCRHACTLDLLSIGQRKAKSTPDLHSAFCPNFTAVSLHDIFADGES